MGKIVPILCLIFAVFGLTVAAIGLTALCIGYSSTTNGVVMLALPVVISGAAITGTSAVLTFFFRRDKLCFIAFLINLVGVILSAISIIIWLAALPH